MKPKSVSPLRSTSIALCALIACCCPVAAVSAASKDLGGGFRDHGVAAPISNHRGTVATVDGNGRNVVLSLLMDHRGGYEVLLVDAETGKTEEFPMPFDPKGDSPYASILSSGNKFYTHFSSHFVEFDPVQRKFTFVSKTTPQMAMGMTEDDGGVIWSVTYPQSGVVSYDPRTKAFKDYGHVYEQNWPQYQRYMAADDAGWVYFGLGATASQVVALDPSTGKATPMFAEDQRKKGSAYVYRDLDGKVYGQSLRGAKEDWWQFYKGKAEKIGGHDNVRPKPIITDSQSLFHTTFPNGERVKGLNLVDRKMTTEDPRGKTTREVSIDYASEGAIVMGAATASDGTVSGGTAFPMRNFSYNPKTDRMINRPGYDQWNAVDPAGDHFFIAGYGGGVLLDWQPGKPWVDTVKGKPTNPALLTECTPVIHRPTRVKALADGKTVIMAGTPQYGYTGGGLLFWDREAKTPTLLTDAQVVPNQSTESFVVLPDGKLLAGTTTSPGSGGEKKAKEAELYVMDLASKKVEWQAVAFPGVQEYTDMFQGPGGLVYGVADRKLFYVFDPATRAVVHQQKLEADFGLTAYQQGPRVFIPGPTGEIYILLTTGVARIEPGSYKLTLLAKSPIAIESGGAYLDGRVYFINGSHLYSYELR
jgi:sugar lactone lactonase YvrE